mgnify:FL=1
MAYGYVRDKEPLSINWAEISKSFNDRLAADEAERQKKRDDIQKQYDDLSQQLINKPTGADTDLNSAISSFSTQAAQASLENLNKLKRGEISEQEYYNRRANLKSSTSNLFLYANNFNNQLQENLALIQTQVPDKQGSGGMAFQMALAQDMLNFKNTVAVIDPATDEVILVKTDEEGNPTNEIVNVAQLGYLSSQQELAYNYKGKISDAIKGRGVAKYTTDDGTTITTIQGAEINPKTATATVNALAESLLGDEAQQRSILYQNGYKYTQDESLKGKEGYIYYDINNNTYDVDTDAALKFVKQDINNSIPVQVDTSKVQTENEKKIEGLQIQNLENQVELGKLKISDERKTQLDTSNLNSEVNRDIAENIGQQVIQTFENNFTGIGQKRKSRNAVNATLDLLNRYGSAFGVEVTTDNDKIYFRTPVYDASGKQLSKPYELSYSLSVLKNGKTLNAILQNFIVNGVAPQFINNAYNTGRFKKPVKQNQNTEVEVEVDEFGVPK